MTAIFLGGEDLVDAQAIPAYLHRQLWSKIWAGFGETTSPGAALRY
jgi:hypothetical protein